MSSSDPEDDICVMELIKRRKAVTSTKSESSKSKSQNSNNNSVKEKKVNGKSNGQSKAKESETKKRKRKDSEDEEEESESEESDSSSSEYESDDDDDKPIGQLVKKRKQDNNKELKNKSKTKDEKKAKSSSSSSLSKKSTEFYNDTGKGMLVQRLLVRWWYVIEWPKPEEIGSPPPGYEALDGFPGVFICTRSDELGKIVDLRNKENCPSLKNLSKWTSSRLKETCIQAYEKQMEVLQKLGEEESETYHNLKQELREIKAVSPDKADKEALKYTF